MVDAGNPRKSKVFLKKISRLGIDPGEIKLIILTHTHFYHAGSAQEIRDLTGAEIIIHESEARYANEGGMIIPSGTNTWGKITKPLFFPLFKRIKFPKYSADILIDQPEYSLKNYGINGKVIHTPGHTSGSISVLLDTGDAFVGCMAHDGLPFRFSPGLPIYAQDIQKLKESWKILLSIGVKMIYPGHRDPFPVEKIIPSISVDQ